MCIIIIISIIFITVLREEKERRISFLHVLNRLDK